MVRLGKGGVVNLSSAVDAVLVVTCAQVFVEDGAVPALKSVLLAVGVTEMVDLKHNKNLVHVSNYNDADLSYFENYMIKEQKSSLLQFLKFSGNCFLFI